MAAVLSIADTDPRIDALVTQVEEALARGELRTALRALNRAAGHRFTGIYRFDGETLKSLALYDRESVGIQVWPDIPVPETYCSFLRQEPVLVVEDSARDSRVEGHSQQFVVFSYCGAALRAPDGTSWGSLCHFDYEPRTVSPADVTVLERVAPAFYLALTGQASNRGAVATPRRRTRR